MTEPDTDVLGKLPPLPEAEKEDKANFLAKKPQSWSLRQKGWLVRAKGKTVTFTEEDAKNPEQPKEGAPVLKKTYPSLHAVYVIHGRLKGDKSGKYLASLVRAIVDHKKK